MHWWPFHFPVSLLVHSYDSFPCPLFVSSLPYFVFCCVFCLLCHHDRRAPYLLRFLQLKDFNTCCCHLLVHRGLFICWVSIFNAYALLPYQSALSYCDLFLYEYNMRLDPSIHPSSSLYQIHRGAGAYTNCNGAGGGVHPSHQSITGLTQRDGQLFSSTASSNHHLTFDLAWTYAGMGTTPHGQTPVDSNPGPF